MRNALLALAGILFIAAGVLMLPVGSKPPGDKSTEAPKEKVPVKYENYTETIPESDFTFEMVWIPEGRFWISKTEVLWEPYEEFFCGRIEVVDWRKGTENIARPSPPYNDHTRGWGRGGRPVIGVAGGAAFNYCRWLTAITGKTYRLPSEKEWEIACGEGPYEPLEDYAWFNGNSEMMTHKVGEKKPNKYGLYDILGNAGEYCLDPSVDFKKEEPQPCVRGGTFRDAAKDCTPARRVEYDDEKWNKSFPNARDQWNWKDLPTISYGRSWLIDADFTGFRVLRPDPNK